MRVGGYALVWLLAGCPDLREGGLVRDAIPFCDLAGETLLLAVGLR
jgi:hypothetical protein